MVIKDCVYSEFEIVIDDLRIRRIHHHHAQPERIVEWMIPVREDVAFDNQSGGLVVALNLHPHAMDFLAGIERELHIRFRLHDVSTIADLVKLVVGVAAVAHPPDLNIPV